jgi:nucleoside 2-deoxyribosyltransferase
MNRPYQYMVKAMKQIQTFFLAGIIQGSNRGRTLYDQDYRLKIKKILKKYFPEAEIVDPVEAYPHSADYDYRKGKKVFFEDIKHATRCDCLIAYLPEASMGTAVEMWECYLKKVPVWSITPMKENWAVKFLSAEIFESLEEFEKYIKTVCFVK